MIHCIPCKQTLLSHVAVKNNLYFSFAILLLHSINAGMTRVVYRPLILIKSFDHHGSSNVLFVVEIIQSLISAFLWCMSTVHIVPNRIGSTMICLANSLVSKTSHHSFTHHHPMAVNNESTIFQYNDDMHDNNDSPNSNGVDNDSNGLHNTSDSNESSSFHNGTSTYEEAMVFFNGLSWIDISSAAIHDRTRLGLSLLIQMTSLSLLNSRYHHHAKWTWVHMSLSSCCS